MSAGRLVVALAAGLVFGLGLSISGMLDPTRVRGFLDVAGAFDPTLIFVLGGAVSVSALGYLLSRRLARPALAPRFEIPTSRLVDARLIGGSALFGVGWGLSGLCPGPAVAGLTVAPASLAAFVAAMLAGMALHHRLGRAKLSADPAATEGRR